MNVLKFFLWGNLMLLAFSGFAINYIPDPDLMLMQLTLDQKIGQLMVVAAVSDPAMNAEFMQEAVHTMDVQSIKKLITDYHVGGVIFLGMSELEKQFALTQDFQQLSAIPLLVCMDFEWGLTMRLRDAMMFPRNDVLGLLSPLQDDLIYQMGYEIGKQCKALGVHLNLAPVVDVNNNPKNPVINSRSFGADKELVAHKAILYMQGLQDAGIMACAKHFPGHGDTDVDSHYDLARITHARERLDDIEFFPFKKLIKAGCMAIMIAHLEVSALEPREYLPTSLSHAVVTALLKDEFDFKGLIITDSLGMVGVTKYHQPGELELEALQAGNDILLCPVDVPKAVAIIKQAISQGRFSEQELDKRVLKVLKFKAWAKSGSMPEAFDRKKFFSYDAQVLQQKLYAHAIA
ncbi:MAG: glycoside hydrolase family 3 N-terminal domain-containing protein [Candidatus Babeliales bacterium]|nr:glycoside hydrolase family 3 N-terminal domain-containing protein [Candidatus Babeliales bacterium]